MLLDVLFDKIAQGNYLAENKRACFNNTYCESDGFIPDEDGRRW